MKRDRGIDYVRTAYMPGVGICNCRVCVNLDTAIRADPSAVGHGDVPDECEYVNREKLFAEKWEEENHPDNQDILSTLFAGRPRLDPDDPDEQLLLFEGDPRLTRRERAVAATAIQWLGTNVGWNFLMDVLVDCGYRVEKEETFETLVAAKVDCEVARLRKALSQRLAEVETKEAELERRIEQFSAIAFGRFETLEEEET